MRVPFNLTQSYTFWIARLASATQERFNSELDTLDLTWSQWNVMNILSCQMANNPASIAEIMGIDRSAVSRLVDRLEKKGLVFREADEEDRRSVKITITEPGKMMISYMDQAAQNHQHQLLGALSESESQRFKLLLKKALSSEGVNTSDW